MIKRLTTLLTVCIACMVSVNAQTKQYALEIGDFTEFTVADNINVNYKYSTDSAGYAVFSCSPKIASAITFTNKSNKIKIEVISDDPITDALPTVTIYSSSLSKATNHGDSTINVLSIKPLEKFSLKILGNGIIKAQGLDVKKFSATSEAGSGHIYADGSCDEATYTIAGAGVVECGSIDADKVKVKMAGTGSVDCTARVHLTVYGVGSGSIYYAGSPEISKRALGVKLVPIDAE